MPVTFQSGVRFRAYPAAAVQPALNRWIGCQRVIYNAKVAEDAYFFSMKRSALSLAGLPTPLDQKYAQFKSDLTPWLSDVPSQILRIGAARWMTAKQRQLKGLAQSPVKKHARGRQTLMLTSELFSIEPFDTAKPGGIHRVTLGTHRFPLGVIRFKAHRPYKHPNQIVVARDAGNWFVSFVYEVICDEIVRTPAELAYEFNTLSDDAVEALTTGYDRGVAKRIADSSGHFSQVDPVNELRAGRKAVRTRRYQRKLARQVAGSANACKTKATIARLQNYRARCTQDWAHKTSYQMVSGTTKIHVFEQLMIANMVRKPKAKKAGNRFVRNGARAKAGLNKSILASGWGRVRQYTQYKAARRNQLVLLVRPHHSSNECAVCGTTHPDNRLCQSVFICIVCGYAMNADTNAALVLKKRGIAALRAGIKSKPKKTVAFRRKLKKNNGSEGTGSPGLSVERSDQSHGGQSLIAHSVTKQKHDGGGSEVPAFRPG